MCLSFEGVSKSVNDGREASHLIYIKGKKGGLLRRKRQFWEGRSQDSTPQPGSHPTAPCGGTQRICWSSALTLPSSIKSLKINAFPKLTLKNTHLGWLALLVTIPILQVFLESHPHFDPSWSNYWAHVAHSGLCLDLHRAHLMRVRSLLPGCLLGLP